MMNKEQKQSILNSLFKKWTDGPKYLLIQFDDIAATSFKLMEVASAIGSNEDLVRWVEEFDGDIGTVYVACDEHSLSEVQAARLDLDIQSAYQNI